MLKSRVDAYELLRRMGASERLILHHRLVGEAADAIIQAYKRLGLAFDAHLIELAAAVHDAGKILHPTELSAPGSLHQADGQELLLRHGVEPKIARCCITHADWHATDVTLEERSVALADKLWKGKREEALERQIIADVASRLGMENWAIFLELDSTFEQVAERGTERLVRSGLA